MRKAIGTIPLPHGCYKPSMFWASPNWRTFSRRLPGTSPRHIYSQLPQWPGFWLKRAKISSLFIPVNPMVDHHFKHPQGFREMFPVEWPQDWDYPPISNPNIPVLITNPHDPWFNPLAKSLLLLFMVHNAWCTTALPMCSICVLQIAKISIHCPKQKTTRCPCI